MRRLIIFVIPFALFACQPKEAVVTEDSKAIAVEKEAKLEALVIDEAAIKAAAVEEALNEKLPLVCPPSTKLKDGQCLCNDQPIMLGDARSWLCVGEPGQFSDCPGDTWLCATVGGCKHGDAVCGFGGTLKDGVCTCLGADKAPDEKMLGDYRCQNGYWVCDKNEGCGEAESACGYDETCFKPVASCFGVELKQDLANYRCENKVWTCRHSKGCACGDGRISAGSQCLDGGASCGQYPKPEKGNYKCVGACTPEQTDSVYQWICGDVEGCPCGDKTCGLGASCHDGECACGVGIDKAPTAIEQYRCYSERALGINKDKLESSDYWMCNREAGCSCGDKRCAMGESCNADGKCAHKDTNRPKYFEDFVYRNEQWTCGKVEGCRCGDTLCASEQACIEGQCSCRSNQDCTQSICSDGRCVKAQGDSVIGAPNKPGYALENNAWICRDYKGCICGDGLCSDGAECREGKCLCGTANNTSLGNSAAYSCNAAQWTCQHRLGCICGSSFAPSGSVCKDGKVYCGDTLVENGRAYHCDDVEGKNMLVCGASDQGGTCVCGEHTCLTGAICKDGQCYCDDAVTPYLADVDGYTYACWSKDFYCKQDDCKCGESDCGRGGRCKNGHCVCGPNEMAAPKIAAAYACWESVYNYEGDEDFETAWRCNDVKGCACGDKQCGHNGICDADKTCRCGKIGAPSINPEKYFCSLDSVWQCNDKEGCPFSGGLCPYRHQLANNKCIAPSYLAEEALDAERENDPAALCLGNIRPPKGNYECVEDAYGLGAAQRTGWTCKEDEGCPCGDEKNVNICKSSCLRSDDGGDCLETTWFGQYLPICNGPRGIGSAETNVDACSDEGILRKPSTPGYSCDKGAWICSDALCTCRLAPCAKGHYCIGDSHCTL